MRSGEFGNTAFQDQLELPVSARGAGHLAKWAACACAMQSPNPPTRTAFSCEGGPERTVGEILSIIHLKTMVCRQRFLPPGTFPLATVGRSPESSSGEGADALDGFHQVRHT
jgi:hypothetical protein